ncbi:helix-turn-helix domain-containing protein [Chryseobacterium nematophagum]|uniref:helix-turn-helix domain-containing protein n=1 Tax=Chryseobacterium nematophagum TaxID=2305228 RepID=UPI001E345A4D|nr:helix-turn-helix domain-containing protein [Chryseobacterium nematophagum]
MKTGYKDFFLEKNRVQKSNTKKEVINKSTINYKLIFSDILDKKHPDKKEECRSLLEKHNLSVLDIIELNKRIFGPIDKETEEFNQSHRSYTESSIFQILDFQKKNHLNNTQVAKHFKLSRHTVAKWKKQYLV